MRSQLASRSGILLSLILLSSTSVSAQTVSALVGVTPCRIIDTRAAAGPFGGPGLGTDGIREVYIPQSPCGIPSNASAYSLNITVIPRGLLNYLTAWPTGATRPLASTLNSYEGKVVANAAIVPAGSSGGVNIYVTDPTDFIIDINGYFVDRQLPSQSSSGTTTQNTVFGSGMSTAAGAQNTAFGASALSSNATASANTAVGAGALAGHSIGNENTAVGTNALSNSADGQWNTAVGSHSLEQNAGGNANTGVGQAALGLKVNGSDNTALGANALGALTQGDGNIAVGVNAGSNLNNGSSYNVDIASLGTAGDNGVIRIGTAGFQNSLFIPPVLANSFGGGLPLVIQAGTGKIGVSSSSRRYKEDIQDLGSFEGALLGLRPVQFRYKQADASDQKPLQFGLIAEEVNAVLPELVVRDPAGLIEGVQYQMLTPLLLKQLQSQHKTMQRQEEQIRQLQQRLDALERGSNGAVAR